MTQYRDNFTSQEAAAKYDQDVYAEGSYSALLSELEYQLVGEGLGEAGQGRGTLDFACGTGRLTRAIPPQHHPAHGIDISSEMVERARLQDSQAEYQVLDVLNSTAVEAAALGRFDRVLAFRFILNSEPRQSLECLSALNQHFCDSQTVLLINNHGNRYSHNIVSYLLARFGIRPAGVTGNTLSHKAATQLFNQAGFEIVDRVGYGLLGGRLGMKLGPDGVSRLEKSFLGRFGSGLIGRLAGHQLYKLRQAAPNRD